MMIRIAPALLLLVLLLAGCGEGEGHAAAADREELVGVVDSILPIEEEIRRFRATLDREPASLSHTSASRDALVARFLRALEARDTAELRRLRMDRAEFAYLYYPHTQYTAPPYALSPALVWYQLENRGSRGLTRALNRYGGRHLGAVGHSCDPEPLVQGENRLWHGCVVHTRGAHGDTASLPLFGPVLEREGRFKLVSYANRL